MLSTTKILLTSLLYTSLVFFAGFLCGLIRIPILEPYLGDRRAQLLETPFMVLAIWKSAQYMVAGLQRTAMTIVVRERHVLGKGKGCGEVVVERRK
jgi:hypothetical protein